MTAPPLSSSEWLTLDGDEVYVEIAGAADAPVVVLGHGAGGNHAIWYQQVPRFAREFRVLTWDQRGFGASTNRHGRAHPRTATSDLAAILDHLGIERAHVVGQSLGGWAALGLLIAHPERVRSLVLADSLGGIPVDGWTKRRELTGGARDGFGDPSALSVGFCTEDPQRARLYQLLGAWRRDPGASTADLFRGVGETTFSDTQLAAIRCPTLFIVGDEDELFPPAWIRNAAARVPGSRVEVVERAGHSPYFERPDVWNDLVERFWHACA